MRRSDRWAFACLGIGVLVILGAAQVVVAGKAELPAAWKPRSDASRPQLVACVFQETAGDFEYTTGTGAVIAQEPDSKDIAKALRPYVERAVTPQP